MSIRPVKRIIESKPTIEGAGVRLRRAFGFGDTGESRGLPRRISVASAPRHRDHHLCPGGKRRSRRQSGKPGQARRRRRAVDDRRKWDSAPGNAARRCAGANARLPALGEPAVIPEDDGAALPGHQGRGNSGDHRRRWDADPRHHGRFLGKDRAGAGRRKTLPVETGRHAFAYVFEGSGTFSSASQPFGVLTEKAADGGEALIRERTGNRSLVLFDSGDEITVQAGEEGMRFLLVSGKPIEEPVAWYGPIVMNTQAELQRAFAELKDGTFIKQG